MKIEIRNANPAPAPAVSIVLPEHLEQYQGMFADLKQSRYLDWPSHIHIETYALCNAACSFCPYPQLGRQGEKMPDELIDKILGDLADIPSDLPIQISPFKVNEPFLDVRLFDILNSINQRLPNASITLTTNATPLNDENLRRLESVRNVGDLWVSFNDHRSEHYEKVMQLPYARTIARLDALHARKQSGVLPFNVVLSRVGDGSAADAEFCGWVAQHYPGFGVSVIPRGAWLGQVDIGMQVAIPRVGCVRWFEISITASGVVAHCCMDGQAAFPIGDASKQHVLDIYNSPHYRALRENALTRMEASPCNKCSFM
jgi:iron-sulfur cluster protein/radical SAM family protein